MENKNAPGEGASLDNNGGQRAIVNKNYTTTPRDLSTPGAIWAAAEREYYRRLSRKNGKARFSVDSLDFFTLCNVSGPTCWAVFDTIYTLLGQLESAKLLTEGRHSDGVAKAVEATWQKMSQASYMPELLARWGEAGR